MKTLTATAETANMLLLINADTIQFDITMPEFIVYCNILLTIELITITTEFSVP